MMTIMTMMYYDYDYDDYDYDYDDYVNYDYDSDYDDYDYNYESMTMMTMTMSMTMGRGRSRSWSRNLSGAGAGNFKNGRLWQPCKSGCGSKENKLLISMFFNKIKVLKFCLKKRYLLTSMLLYMTLAKVTRERLRSQNSC